MMQYIMMWPYHFQAIPLAAVVTLNQPHWQTTDWFTAGMVVEREFFSNDIRPEVAVSKMTMLFFFFFFFFI